MKTKNFFNRFALVALLTSALFIYSCDKDNNDDDRIYTLSGNGNGAQENPPNTTTGSASLTGQYNANTNLLNYTINWSGITGLVSMMHFHGPAMVGVNAGILTDLNITTNGISGTSSGSMTLADTTENHLLNGRIYFNIHTVAYPAGEIRGQVTATAK